MSSPRILSERKSSVSAEELTPIVLNQLQTTSKMKEESRKSRRGAQLSSNNSHNNNVNDKMLTVSNSNNKVDSESESCGEETRKKTAEAFMSGIQSALQQQQQPQGEDGEERSGSGLSRELVSEVDSVLSKLLSSVDKGDPNLVPLIASLQATLKANVDKAPGNKSSSKLILSESSKSNSITSENSPGTPGSQKEWMKDPFGSLPRKPATRNVEEDFGPVVAKTFEAPKNKTSSVKPDLVPASEFSGGGGNEEDDESHVSSKIPWKIRAARRRQMKHHTTGMTKDEFAQIKLSLQESADKLTPHPVGSYALSRNKSEGAIRQQKSQQPPETTTETRLPATYRLMEGNRAYADLCKSTDNLYKSSDLGYASDVCDYNVAAAAASKANGREGTRGIQQDTSYVLQQKRPVSMVSPSLKPSSPSIESSLYDRRQRVIRNRARIFLQSDSQSPIPSFHLQQQQQTAIRAEAVGDNSREITNDSLASDISTADNHTVHSLSFMDNPAYLPPEVDVPMVRSNADESLQTSREEGKSPSSQLFLSVPANETSGALSQQSSVEEDSSKGGEKKNSKATSAVRAKIARRKMMRTANSMDNPQGSLSDQEVTNDEEDSVEEKQDSEPINEKASHLQTGSQSGYGSQLTPELGRKNWSSRFSNIKHTFDAAAASEEDAAAAVVKSRSPSINRQQQESSDSRGRAKIKDKNAAAGVRSRSAHNVKATAAAAAPVDFARIDYGERQRRSSPPPLVRAQSKEDKNKLNAMTAGGGGSGPKTGYLSDSSSHSTAAAPAVAAAPSGRDSVDYHQYLEMIEKFRDNNPKVYSRPLQKSVPCSTSIKVYPREMIHHHPAPQPQPQPPPPSIPKVSNSGAVGAQAADLQTRAEVLGLVRTQKDADAANKNHDMDYQEYMNIINKVRKTKEFTRVRFEQIRLASMYAKEKKRQEELKLEEERLKAEREQIEQESRYEARRASVPYAVNPGGQIGGSLKNTSFEREQLESTEQSNYPNPRLAGNIGVMSNYPGVQQQVSQQQPQKQHHMSKADEIMAHNFEQQKIRQEQARMEQIRLERLEQKRQEELRELQVKAEQEKLIKLREDQLKQEKEREEIRRLEYERLLQIQEEQQRLEFERERQEQNIRTEQLRLEEERRRQEKIQAEKNALYNRQRLDMEAKNFAINSESGIRDRVRNDYFDSHEPMSPEETLLKERLAQQEKLRDEHRREESQIRQEKLQLIQQEQTLIARQEEMLKQIEEERLNLAKQEELIRSRQQGRLQHVRQEKLLLEKQEEMLKMREQQLLQERLRQDNLRHEQRALKEQEEAIRRRQEEISKELLMSSDLSDTGSESITMCQPREGQVFMGKKPIIYPDIPAAVPETMMQEDSDSDNTLGGGEEDYYETKVEVKQKSTSVPTSVRTIETKLDNPPWAPITPYLNYSDRQNQDEISELFSFGGGGGRRHSLTKAGIVTSPESVGRNSTNLITTPESSLQSQMSQNDVHSLSSSCPNSPPPPIPPLPAMDQRMFMPVQPVAPPRDDSFVYSSGNTVLEHSPRQDSLDIVMHNGHKDLSISPKIGGPGSAFKPYASSENLYDESLFSKKSPEITGSLLKPAFPPIANPVRNGHPNGGGHAKHSKQPVYSKIRELKQNVQPPFSTTDTEPEMRECKLQDAKGKRIKAKVPTYSTSETEEEYQSYLKMRPKWHGKGGHKDSWDPLLIESPPQITQKPVGIIQKPKALAPGVSVERGAQVGQTPVFMLPMTTAYEAPKGGEALYGGDAPLPLPKLYERIQKSDSIIEVRGIEQRPHLQQHEQKLTAEVVPPPPAMDAMSYANHDVSALTPWARPLQLKEADNALVPVLHMSDQIKSRQDKYLENVNSSDHLTQPKFGPFAKTSTETFPSRKRDDDTKPQQQHQDVGGGGFVKRPYNIKRTNPTIAAMEIMTRKELKLNEMEERLARENKARALAEAAAVFHNQIRPPSPSKLAAPAASHFRQTQEVQHVTEHQPIKATVKPIEKTTQIIGNFVPRMEPPRVPVPVQQVHPVPEKLRPVSLQQVKASKSFNVAQQQSQEEQQSELPLVRPHPSMVSKEPLVKGKNSPQPDEQAVILLKKHMPKILASAELNTRKGSGDVVRTKEVGSTQQKVKVEKQKAPKKKLIADVRPQNKSDHDDHSRIKAMEDEIGKNSETVRRVAEKFEQASKSESQLVATSSPTATGQRARSKSIGNNLYQKLQELEDDKTRIKESLTQAKVFLPWTSGGEGEGKKAPVLKRRDATMNNKRDGYELRLSKSSDSITAAKLLAEARMRQQGHGRLATQPHNISKSIEQQIDVYTKTREDIRRILELAKNCSVSDRVRLFNTQKAVEPDHERDERMRKAEAIKREIEEAKASQKEEERRAAAAIIDSGGRVRIQEPIASKVKPLKIPMKPKLVKATSSEDRRGGGVPGSKLRINQPSGQEIKSILRHHGGEIGSSGEDRDQRRLSVENLPSVKSKIESYLHETATNSGSREERNRKEPRLLQSLSLKEGETLKIYAQSATDHSATEEEDEDEDRAAELMLLKVPEQSSSGQLTKSKSFAGQFECALDDAEIDEKQRTMLEFFYGKKKESPSPVRRVEPQQRPPPQPQRQTSLSDEILGDADLRDVDAMFESLLNNTFEDEDSGSGGGGGARRRQQPNKQQQTWPSSPPPPPRNDGSDSPSLSEYETCGGGEAWDGAD